MSNLAAQPPAESRHARRLAQIRRRDPKAEDVFWYSVVTTGVYCRPTCPSRQAHPAHIQIHETLAAARRTGFRPCRRCKPEEPSLHAVRLALVEAACRRLVSEEGVSGLELAASAGLSPSQFYRVFRRITGTTPAGYARRCRSASPAPPIVCAEHPSFQTA